MCWRVATRRKTSSTSATAASSATSQPLVTSGLKGRPRLYEAVHIGVAYNPVHARGGERHAYKSESANGEPKNL